MRRSIMDRRYTASKYRRGRQLRRFLAVLIVVFMISGAIFLTYAKTETDPREQGQTAQTEDGAAAADLGTAEPQEPEEEASRGEKPVIPTQTEETEDQQAEEKQTDKAAGPAAGTPAADCDTLVPQSGAVDLDYFDDAVFIGDSRTEGLYINTGLSNATFFAHQGLMVDEVYTKEVVTVDGKKTTVMDALARTSFSKVYIMLGINETGWIYEDIFIEKYGDIIDGIRAINPDAVIYVQSILPVSQEVSETHSYIKNERISTYNQLLQEMAEEKGVYFVNVAEAVTGSDGSLPADLATDGIHLKKAPCETWLTYLREHTVAP